GVAQFGPLHRSGWQRPRDVAHGRPARAQRITKRIASSHAGLGAARAHSAGLLMTQLPQPHHDAPHAEAPPLSVWGLAVPELHDAYWRGRGVQCVRPGVGCAIDRAADLFLLMDAHQLVLFDLSRLVDRLVWHGAAVTFVQ